ncbi:hypothetical protein, partial [Mariniflexile maritimum]|uniref:hypothetical protein n=1 Tax=Mariniflexile maritimum TaxID=2682493 RepID=UPI001E3319DE
KPVYLAETSLSLLFLLALLIRNLLFLNSINDPAVNIRAETVANHLKREGTRMNKDESIMDEKQVDIILSESINSEYYQLRTNYKTNEERKSFIKNVSILLGYGILNEIGGKKYEITNLGRKLKKYECVKKYINGEKEKLIKKEKKDRYDYFFSKYRYWTFWIAFILGTFGGIYGLYDAFIKSQSNEEELNKIKQDILENKKSIKEVRIEISDQKKDSSLHQSSSE